VSSDVDLLVNCYERTYRQVIRPGFFEGISGQVKDAFSSRYLLINNVNDPADAGRRAEELRDSAEITDWAFVADLLPRALSITHVSPSALRHAGYLVDYGLTMAVFGDAPYLVGWDAEVTLEHDYDWVSPGVELLQGEPRVFSVNPDWPTRGGPESTMRMESFGQAGPYFINYGFCDQLFLVRRTDIATPIYRSFAPTVLAMRAEYPRTFEARIESHQRTKRQVRATDSRVRYTHNDLSHPLERSGDMRGYRFFVYRSLRYSRRLLESTLPTGPRLRAYPPASERRGSAWTWP
jgi:hypothetical protein